MRDPRIEPISGDVVKRVRGAVYLVLEIRFAAVRCAYVLNDGSGFGESWTTLADWPAAMSGSTVILQSEMEH